MGIIPYSGPPIYEVPRPDIAPPPGWEPNYGQLRRGKRRRRRDKKPNGWLFQADDGYSAEVIGIYPPPPVRWCWYVYRNGNRLETHDDADDILDPLASMAAAEAAIARWRARIVPSLIGEC